MLSSVWSLTTALVVALLALYWPFWSFSFNSSCAWSISLITCRCSRSVGSTISSIFSAPASLIELLRSSIFDLMLSISEAVVFAASCASSISATNSSEWLFRFAIYFTISVATKANAAAPKLNKSCLPICITAFQAIWISVSVMVATESASTFAITPLNDSPNW